MKPVANPEANLWLQESLEKDFKLDVHAHHFWSNLQVQGKNEKILDSLPKEEQQKLIENAMKENSKPDTILRLENLRRIEKNF